MWSDRGHSNRDRQVLRAGMLRERRRDDHHVGGLRAYDDCVHDGVRGRHPHARGTDRQRTMSAQRLRANEQTNCPLQKKAPAGLQVIAS